MQETNHEANEAIRYKFSIEESFCNKWNKKQVYILTNENRYKTVKPKHEVVEWTPNDIFSDLEFSFSFRQWQMRQKCVHSQLGRSIPFHNEFLPILTFSLCRLSRERQRKSLWECNILNKFPSQTKKENVRFKASNEFYVCVRASDVSTAPKFLVFTRVPHFRFSRLIGYLLDLSHGHSHRPALSHP